MIQLATNPKDAVMVGDDLIRDIQGAKAVGMNTILVTQFREAQQVTSEDSVPDLVLDPHNEPFRLSSYLLLSTYDIPATTDARSLALDVDLASCGLNTTMADLPVLCGYLQPQRGPRNSDLDLPSR